MTDRLPRRSFIKQSAATGVALAAFPAIGCSGEPRNPSGSLNNAVAPFALDEVAVSDLQAGLTSGQYTAADLTRQYLERIVAIDKQGPAINSVIEVNPDAMSIASEMDAERKAGRVRGPMHGIPVLIKDNINTADRMMTSAGSFALADSPALQDAGLVARMRDAGMVIIGKTNLSEWANIRSTRSTSGWSARGGLTRNPYALDRNPCGSSSGTGAALAASLAAVGVGTETDGSIVCPAHVNGLAGIKPTVGLVSRVGIAPISHSQDTAGPMCRTVRDAAALLSVLAGVDARDPASAASEGKGHDDYTTFCDAGALKGARIGVVRQMFNAGPSVDAIMEASLKAMQDAGAILIDPVSIPSLNELGEHELTVMAYELKADMALYLEARGASSKHRTLADLIQFNKDNAAREMPHFGQEIFLIAESKGPLTDGAYRDALRTIQRLTRAEGMDRVLAEHRLDALVAPTGGPAWLTDLVNGDHFGGGSSSLCAISGYPAITVPAGFVSGLPVGLTLMGPAWSEGKLISYAYAFEQAMPVRKAPTFRPTVEI